MTFQGHYFFSDFYPVLICSDKVSWYANEVRMYAIGFKCLYAVVHVTEAQAYLGEG